jgi:hypothetical protein
VCLGATGASCPHPVPGVDRRRESDVGLHPFVEHNPRSFGSRIPFTRSLAASLKRCHAAPYLLSSGGRLSAGWPVGSLAGEARTPERSQTHVGRSGLRYATPDERSFAASSGLGCCYTRTVRYKCSSTEYRARTETTGKKTSLNPAAGARKTTEPATLSSAYEDLRRQAAECSISGGLGMAIFLHRGMVAWMLACSWVASNNPEKARRCPTTAVPLPVELRGEIVLVMAAMALKQVPEVYPCASKPTRR